MKISTKGRYALRIMLDLAENESDKYISLKEISERQGITIKYLEQIIPLLNKAGYLESRRGSLGGYKLSKTPEQYSAGDILRCAEGSLAPVSCLENDCERCGECLTFPFWQGLESVINSYVDGVTLKDLMKK